MKIVARALVVSLFLFLCAPGVLARQQWVPFEQEGKWGYQDAQGKVAIAPTFIAAHDFSPEGIAAVIDDAGWGYINRRGTIIIRPFVFDNGPDPFQEGLARFTQEGKFGFFDRRGKVVIKPKFDFAAPFQEGLSAFCQRCTKNMSRRTQFLGRGKMGIYQSKRKHCHCGTIRLCQELRQGASPGHTRRKIDIHRQERDAPHRLIECK